MREREEKPYVDKLYYNSSRHVAHNSVTFMAIMASTILPPENKNSSEEKDFERVILEAESKRKKLESALRFEITSKELEFLNDTVERACPSNIGINHAGLVPATITSSPMFAAYFLEKGIDPAQALSRLATTSTRGLAFGQAFTRQYGIESFSSSVNTYRN